jgi:peptidoglycan/LPS O-acetylase OafA/YrhL
MSQVGYRPTGHLPALDGLRGVAILAVILLHFTFYTDATAVDAVFSSITKSGWAGVDLFFVLSGFLITRILLAAKGAPGYFRNFYARRALRIFPLYYAYLLSVTVVLPLIFPTNEDVAWWSSNAFWHWTYLSNVLPLASGQTAEWSYRPNGHLWSLSVEEQFYLLWPLVVFLLSRRGLFIACIGIIMGAVAARLTVALATNYAAAYMFLLPARMDTLAIGGLLALACLTHYDLLARYAPRALLASGTLLVVLSIPSRRLGMETPLQVSAGLTLLAVFCAALLMCSLVNQPRVLGSRFLTTIGKYSYCMYVVHLIAGDFVGRHVRELSIPAVFGSQLPMELTSVLVGTAVTFGIAWSSWHLWEKHWLKLKARFDNRNEGVAALRARPAASANTGGFTLLTRTEPLESARDSIAP